MHKSSSSMATNTTTSASSPTKQHTPSSTPQQPPPGVQRSNFEDWVGGDDDDGYYFEGAKRQRGGGKNKKNKKKKTQQETRVWDWDDIYDPTLPNNYADYKRSEEQIKEIRDWKARLYYHQLKEAKQQGRSGAGYSEEGDEEQCARPINSTCARLSLELADRPTGMFAPPPSNLSFAPPTFDNEPPAPPPLDDDDEGDYRLPEDNDDYSSPEPRPVSSDGAYEHRSAFAQPSTIHSNATGEDAYMRRMQMSGMVSQSTGLASAPLPPPPPAVRKPEDADVEAKRAAAQAKIAAFKAKLQKPPANPNAAPVVSPPAPPTQASMSPAAQSPLPPPSSPPSESEPVQAPSGTISRAPVRYNVPPPSTHKLDSDNTAMEVDSNENAPSTNKQSGKKGFAERMLKKYGWQKGQGLGAQGEGIATPIIAQAEKRKKLPDAKGGGWAAPANMGKIVGGKRRKVDTSAGGTSEEDARFGIMSAVVKVEGMLRGVDVQRGIEEGNLLQTVGEEMEERYGNVERVFVWGEESGGSNEVFVKFTSELSALRAVNAVDGVGFVSKGIGEGGEGVVARFFDAEMFEKGEFGG